MERDNNFSQLEAKSMLNGHKMNENPVDRILLIEFCGYTM